MTYLYINQIVCAVEEMKTDWYLTLIFSTVMSVIFLWIVTIDVIAEDSHNKQANLMGGTALI